MKSLRGWGLMLDAWILWKSKWNQNQLFGFIFISSFPTVRKPPVTWSCITCILYKTSFVQNTSVYCRCSFWKLSFTPNQVGAVQKWQWQQFQQRKRVFPCRYHRACWRTLPYGQRFHCVVRGVRWGEDTINFVCLTRTILRNEIIFDSGNDFLITFLCGNELKEWKISAKQTHTHSNKRTKESYILLSRN